MATFTLDDIVDLQEILNLDISELELDSELRNRCSEIEDLDTRLGTDKVTNILATIALIKTIDADIILTQSDPNFTSTSVRIEDEYSVSYQNAYSKDMGFKQRRSQLIDNLRRDLRIGYNQISGRLVRR
jgi:hypothetical protein